ncbi:MAG: hypothetical protein ACI3U8_09185 [Candidatus Onthomonas sp.]
MKWREAAQKIGTVLLVSVFALCFAVAVWKLSGDHESRVWDREATLAERYDLLAAAQLEQDGDAAVQARREIILQSVDNRTGIRADLP